jgi:hypothetical protein
VVHEGSAFMTLEEGVLEVPSGKAETDGAHPTLDGKPIIPIPYEAPAETAEALITRELFVKNIASFRKILGDWPTKVRNPVTREFFTEGVIRRIGFDRKNSNGAYYGDYATGITERTHPGTDRTFFTFTGVGNRPEGRFFGQHCIWQLDPESGQAQVSAQDPTTGEYSPFEPMTKNDHAQMRFSMFDAYEAAQRGRDRRRVWHDR